MSEEHVTAAWAELEAVNAHRSWRRNKTGLFTGWWTDLNGKRLRRVRRNEYGELYRLWAKHADIRTGK